MGQFEAGGLKNFSYLICDWKNRKTACIDPPKDLRAILSALETHQLLLDRILLTHTHFDHIGGVRELLRHFPAATLHTHAADQHRLPGELQEQTQPIAQGDVISIGSLSVEVIHTPGHSAGAVCYRLDAPDPSGEVRSYLFSGDTVFIRDCGRTDLETGSSAELFESLQRLKKLSPATLLLPGHHYARECASTLEQEFRESPPFQCRSAEELERLP